MSQIKNTKLPNIWTLKLSAVETARYQPHYKNVLCVVSVEIIRKIRKFQ